ncbi:MAG TPA: ankyrin repeat domain-containing protein [Candidatus Babeliales bacterium]|nr:ankyrin repeat domain-containing protein [Candidatus Babeliales bacterium]
MKTLSLSLMFMLSTCYADDTQIEKLQMSTADSEGSKMGAYTLKEHNDVKKYTASYFEGVKKNSMELCIALASCIGCKMLCNSPKNQNAQMAVVAGAFGVLLLVDSVGNIIKWPKQKATQDLLLAIDKGDVAKAKEYLQHGADANQCNGYYVNSITLEHYCDSTPLYFASAKGNAQMVKMLLKHNANVNQQVNGQTPLYIAAARGNGEVVKVLVEDGKADIWQTGFNNKNILQVATGSARKYLAAYYAAMVQ